MNVLPQDPIMLLSVVNMKLRDRYASLAALCDDLSVEENTLRAVLQSVGYHYDEDQNAFIA